MIVVSDTSVISALIQIGRAELLLEIFGEVVIPKKVAAELEDTASFRISPDLEARVLRDAGELPG